MSEVEAVRLGQGIGGETSMLPSFVRNQWSDPLKKQLGQFEPLEGPEQSTQLCSGPSGWSDLDSSFRVRPDLEADSLLIISSSISGYPWGSIYFKAFLATGCHVPSEWSSIRTRPTFPSLCWSEPFFFGRECS